MTAPLPDKASQLGSLLFGVRRPLRRALERLAVDSSRVTRAFAKDLHHLEPHRGAYVTPWVSDLLPCYRALAEGGPWREAGDEAYCDSVERLAASLIRAAVPVDHAIGAVGLHLEACLKSVKDPAEAKALTRLTSATQWLLAVAYCEGQVASLRLLDDRERQKASGDLHDEVGADLIFLKLYVEMIAAELAKGRFSTLRPKLEEALALIAHAIEAVRRLTLELGPAFLDTLGFLPVLRNFIRQFSQRTGIKVEFKEPDSPIPMPPGHEAALYRVLLGALSNVAKHARARHVRVSLRRARGMVVMLVEDDGRGFDVRVPTPDQSFGLNAMRERIRSLDGRVLLSSRRTRRSGGSSGTRLEVRVPLRSSPRP